MYFPGVILPVFQLRHSLTTLRQLAVELLKLEDPDWALVLVLLVLVLVLLVLVLVLVVFFLA